MNLELIKTIDPETAAAIESELYRQENTLEMIASENMTSLAVMATQGSVLTNKYAEGYPENRYYGGCEYVDKVEQLAIDRAKALFGAEYANVQPHSGSQANMAVYFALLKNGDRVLGMDLAHGGHLTHGSSVSFSGKCFQFAQYGVDKDTGLIDYDKVAQIAEAFKPKLIVAGASAYPRILEFDKFARISQSVNAYLMVDMAHIAGLVATGLHPSPIPYADVVTSTTHKTLRGPRGGLILAKQQFAKKLNSEIFPGIQGGPLMHVIAAKAVAFQAALNGDFKQYQQDVVTNAKTLADTLMKNGIKLVSGGTDNHMILVDLRNLDITGKFASDVLERAGITTNKNAVPFDERGPKITSGIRIGTPAITTRGMKSTEMLVIGELIVKILKHPEDESIIQKVRAEVDQLCRDFPVYPELSR